LIAALHRPRHQDEECDRLRKIAYYPENPVHIAVAGLMASRFERSLVGMLTFLAHVLNGALGDHLIHRFFVLPRSAE
jgi:hypothetical protein